MTTIINASSVNGITISSDTSGQLAFQSNGGNTITVPQVAGTMLTTGSPQSGGVIQVVSVNDTTQYTFNSGSSNQNTYYNVTNLVASITPKFSTSKILILCDITAGQTNNSYNAFFRPTRNGTVIAVGNASGFNGTSTSAFRSSDGGEIGTVGINYLDSPATTSTLTYQIQICNSGGSSSPSYVNRPVSFTAWEQTGASTITLMEIAG